MTMKHWYQKWWGILTILILLLIASSIGAAGIYVYNQALAINQEKAQAAAQAQYQSERQLLELGSSYFLGTSTPKITIIEFSDFACPYCQASFQTVEDLGVKYKNDIKIIFRNFLGHDDSLDLATAAACAGAQNKFWEMHDQLFAQQGKITKTDYPQIAQEIGLNVNSFNTCLAANSSQAPITQDENVAKELGVTGTPTWFIDNQKSIYKIPGMIPEADFSKTIDQLLKL